MNKVIEKFNLTENVPKINFILNEFNWFISVHEDFFHITILNLRKSQEQNILKAHCYAYAHDPIIVLSDLDVNEAYRKQGYGAKLQMVREEIGILVGCTTSMLWVSPDHWAVDWYKRRGYELTGTYHDETDFWMHKELK